MKYWNWVLQVTIAIGIVVGIGCAPPPSSSKATQPPPAESSTTELAPAATPRSDNFDQGGASLFEIKEPNKIENGMLGLQASQEEGILLSSVDNLSEQGYTVSAKVMPPGLGEQVGLAFAVRSKDTRGLFYLYRSAGADRFAKRCNVGVDVLVGGRDVRSADVRVRDIEFQPDTPIKLSVRQVGPTVFLLINDQNIGRFHESTLKVGKVGIYGKSQHTDGSPATVKFDSFEIE